MRNTPAKTDGNFPPTAQGARGMIATASFGDLFHGWVRRRYQPLRHAEEKLARDAGCTPRTARGWLRGEHAAQGEHLLALMANCADLVAEINEAVEARRCAEHYGSNSAAPAPQMPEGR